MSKEFLWSLSVWIRTVHWQQAMRQYRLQDKQSYQSQTSKTPSHHSKPCKQANLLTNCLTIYLWDLIQVHMSDCRVHSLARQGNQFHFLVEYIHLLAIIFYVQSSLLLMFATIRCLCVFVGICSCIVCQTVLHLSFPKHWFLVEHFRCLAHYPNSYLHGLRFWMTSPWTCLLWLDIQQSRNQAFCNVVHNKGECNCQHLLCNPHLLFKPMW